MNGEVDGPHRLRHATPPQISAALGIVVRELRERVGFSIEELAHAGGLDASYLSGIERGLRRPSLEKIEGIARALEMEASDLVRLAEKVPRTDS